MTIKIIKSKLSYLDQELNALIFLPSPSGSVKKALGVFTHGYTSHKGSILSWATRLAEEGIGAIIYDQPGHFLGTYSEVHDFDQFKELAPALFYQGFLKLKEHFLEELPLSAHIFDEVDLRVLLGGHSLGALMSLMAVDSKEFKDVDTTSICVGLGMPPVGITHIFESPFYKSTLNIRKQLVSEELRPENILPWIKERKENLSLKNKRIHFITGADDIIVGRGGTQIMVDRLSLDNELSFDEPAKMPHHMPEMAAPHIKKFLRDEKII